MRDREGVLGRRTGQSKQQVHQEGKSCESNQQAHQGQEGIGIDAGEQAGREGQAAGLAEAPAATYADAADQKQIKIGIKEG